jgi:hypothetical protein
VALYCTNATTPATSIPRRRIKPERRRPRLMPADPSGCAVPAGPAAKKRQGPPRGPLSHCRTAVSPPR